MPPEQLPKRYPARQTPRASEAVFRRHGVANALVLQQSPDAIDAGVFHNDVISVANESVLLMHERTFAQADAAMDAIRAATATLAERDWFHPIIIHEADVPLTDAIRSYLFNTQIVRMNDGSMMIVAPMECAETPSVHAALTRITQANETPIRQVEYLDVRESMRNGGGPACLRLRVVLTEAERAASHQGIWLTDARYAQLVAWVETHYRDRLSPADLADPQLAIEVQTAMSALESILGLSLI